MNKIITNESIILLVLLFTSIFSIYKSYQTPVTSKTFLINIYLYIIFALLFIAYIGTLTQNMEITHINNIWKFLIMYFIMGCGGIFMMINDNMFVNHIGFLLLLLALSLVMGSSYRYSSNVTQASAITAIIISVLTMVVFSTSEENLTRMVNWLPNLTFILLCIIIIEFGYMLLFSSNDTWYRLMSITVIALFVFFILSDTSRILLQSKNLECETHSCINYPLKSTSLILDYMNIFVRLLDRK